MAASVLVARDDNLRTMARHVYRVTYSGDLRHVCGKLFRPSTELPRLPMPA
jgi:hypothetical protein